MQKNPFISIISITLNNLPGLRKTHESLKIQSCRDFEWIVIDGRSNDETTRFLAQTDAQWQSGKDRGIYDAMNKGLELARGDYVLFLNAGDALTEPETLEKIERACAANTPPDFMYGDSLENGCYKTARSHKKFNLGMFTHHQAMLYRRKKIQALRYDLTYKIAADYDFTCRFLQRAQAIQRLSFPVCIFESGGISQQQGRDGRLEQFAVRDALKCARDFENVLIYGTQSMAWKLRKAAPRLYWRLKSSRSSGNSGNGLTRNESPAARQETRASRHSNEETQVQAGAAKPGKFS